MIRLSDFWTQNITLLHIRSSLFSHFLKNIDWGWRTGLIMSGVIGRRRIGIWAIWERGREKISGAWASGLRRRGLWWWTGGRTVRRWSVVRRWGRLLWMVMRKLWGSWSRRVWRIGYWGTGCIKSKLWWLWSKEFSAKNCCIFTNDLVSLPIQTSFSVRFSDKQASSAKFLLYETQKVRMAFFVTLSRCLKG